MLRGSPPSATGPTTWRRPRNWYAELLGIQPYLVRPGEGPPACVELRVGDYQDELGIIDRRYAPQGAAGDPGGAVMFWRVASLKGS